MTTRDKVDTHDQRDIPVPEPILDKAARDLDLQVPIEHAYYGPSGTLYIVTRYDLIEIAPAYSKTDTLPTQVAHDPPSRGSNDPASPSAATPTAARHPTGGSAPPKTADETAAADPEPPPTPRSVGPYTEDDLRTWRHETRAHQANQHTALDDFTAIDGVGPVTAQKLHDLGFYTYQDLQTWFDNNTTLANVSSHTQAKIKAWLDQRAEAHRADRDKAASISA